jgi:RNA polymerase sigma-70 factor (ECF subfamily)
MASRQVAISEEMQIQLVRGSDAGAFCELIRPYGRRLYLKTLSIVGNDADAEEVVQNALLKAFNKISQFRQEPSFYTGLFRITVNEARMWLRSSRRHIHESLDNNNEDGEGQLVREIGDSREGPFEVLEKNKFELRFSRLSDVCLQVIAKSSFCVTSGFAASRRQQEFLPSQKST